MIFLYFGFLMFAARSFACRAEWLRNGSNRSVRSSHLRYRLATFIPHPRYGTEGRWTVWTDLRDVREACGRNSETSVGLFPSVLHHSSPLPRSCRIPHYAHVFSILSRSGSSEMDDVRREVNVVRWTEPDKKWDGNRRLPWFLPLSPFTLHSAHQGWLKPSWTIPFVRWRLRAAKVNGSNWHAIPRVWGRNDRDERSEWSEERTWEGTVVTRGTGKDTSKHSIFWYSLKPNNRS